VGCKPLSSFMWPPFLGTTSNPAYAQRIANGRGYEPRALAASATKPYDGQALFSCPTCFLPCG
jgi:hypothetical protein